jgi:hypothetical protein
LALDVSISNVIFGICAAILGANFFGGSPAKRRSSRLKNNL